MGITMRVARSEPVAKKDTKGRDHHVSILWPYHLWVDTGYQARRKEGIEQGLGLSVEIVHRAPSLSLFPTDVWGTQCSEAVLRFLPRNRGKNTTLLLSISLEEVGLSRG
jgi:hypothetical protein